MPPWAGALSLWRDAPESRDCCGGNVRNSNLPNCTVSVHFSSSTSSTTATSRQYGKRYDTRPFLCAGTSLTEYRWIVHGSLARAGKVKSQTPKVDKQEKKKTPKGRAKKRILYNRRFVNVTTLPGGKRRM
ncbi:hypothetical protein M413DRAFT_72124 [Hebeloma cylindrosporum]|uniref:Uncharacterized protein n=1 Tax=Hebeloma cylindrosporum TaxID=76867 RepID=A0A0C3CBG5_HEBCY|nr:hypothetical protein M413DRAFT_72124 [Hebeloma cylindrosporum h7]